MTNPLMKSLSTAIPAGGTFIPAADLMVIDNCVSLAASFNNVKLTLALCMLTEKIFTESPESCVVGTDLEEDPRAGSK